MNIKLKQNSKKTIKTKNEQSQKKHEKKMEHKIQKFLYKTDEFCQYVYGCFEMVLKSG